MKNRTSKILLVGAMCLSVGVMLAEQKKSCDVNYNHVHDYDVSDLSKMEVTCASTIDFTVHNYYGYDQTGLIESFDYSFKREWTSFKYDAGKVQNKALPLSKRIWLLNCQIALK